MAYRANVTDKQQADVERAQDDSAIRFAWFDGKAAQTGLVKSVRAFDLSAQANSGTGVTSAKRMIAGTTTASSSIGSHNDQPHRFATPGKA